MTRQRRKPSDRLIEKYRTVYRLGAMLSATLYCRRMKQDCGVDWSDEEKQILHAADRSFDAAQDQVRKIFETRIGRAIVSEIRMGL
jgi:hypothetical protein